MERPRKFLSEKSVSRLLAELADDARALPEVAIFPGTPELCAIAIPATVRAPRHPKTSAERMRNFLPLPLYGAGRAVILAPVCIPV